MRLSLPRLTILTALGVSPSTPFVIPSLSGGNYLSTTSTLSQQQAIATFSNTALHAKKKAKNTAKDAALAALEALEAQDQQSTSPVALDFDDDEPLSKKDLLKQQKKSKSNGAVATNGAPADLDAILAAVDEEPLSKKEQMALEKKKQKEAKRLQVEEERKMKEEMDEMEKNKRKKALKVGSVCVYLSFILCDRAVDEFNCAYRH